MAAAFPLDGISRKSHYDLSSGTMYYSYNSHASKMLVRESGAKPSFLRAALSSNLISPSEKVVGLGFGTRSPLFASSDEIMSVMDGVSLGFVFCISIVGFIVGFKEGRLVGSGVGLGVGLGVASSIGNSKMSFMIMKKCLVLSSSIRTSTLEQPCL